jgi:Na+-driven multidrug efflux pump
MCCGILRAVGAQFYSSVVMFFSFYVIGASTGLVLLLKTTLQVWGFYIGIFFAEFVLVSLQVLYITKINWKKMAQNVKYFFYKFFNLLLKI